MNHSTDIRRIVDFFDRDYRWWDDVYAESLPRGFLSFEMLRRRSLLVQYLGGRVDGVRPLRVLECGCGPGGIIRALDLRWMSLTAVDLNGRLLRLAREQVGANVAWLQADAERLPFADNSFDLAYCAGVLSYLAQDDAAVAELARVVRPGGEVVVALPNWWMLGRLLDPYYPLVWLPARLLSGLRRRHRLEGGALPIRRYRFARFAALCRRHGLQVVRRSSVSFGPPTLWRREILPLPWAMRLSEALRRLSDRSGFHLLQSFDNHWIAALKKTANGEGVLT